MLTWLLIIFALALIFGVIKVEQLKQWGEKTVTFIKENLNKDLINKEEIDSDNEKNDQ